jgi:hypothetical protein
MLDLIFVEVAVICLHLFVENFIGRLRIPLERISRIAHTLNVIYSVASLIGLLWWLYLVATHLSRHSFCGSFEFAEDLSRFYFWSKLWEGISDLNSVTFRGYPINSHFRIHHYTTPIFAWLGWRTRSAHAFYFMGMNLFMHFMVYLWHGNIQIPIFKPLIRFWQYVQLLGGILLCAIAYFQCATSTWVDLIPAVLFSTYFVLFQFEIANEK